MQINWNIFITQKQTTICLLKKNFLKNIPYKFTTIASAVKNQRKYYWRSTYIVNLHAGIFSSSWIIYSLGKFAERLFPELTYLQLLQNI